MQAIATARRLGAIVSATDVRPAAKEEIKSLGATFVGVEDEETAGQTGAYAKEMSDAFRQKQAELMAATVAKNDIVICTALVMGRKAPTIVTQADGGRHARRQRDRRSRLGRRRQLRRHRCRASASSRRTA